MTMHKRAHAIVAEAIRRYESYRGVRIVQTRLAVSILVLLLANFTTAFKNPAGISWIMLAYIVLTLLRAKLFSTVFQLKRGRAIPDLLDLITISFLVRSTGGLESSWFLLYLFPVISVSRYLGPGWSLAVAVFSSLTYAWASGVLLGSDPQTVYLFGFRALVLGGVALTTAKLPTIRDRAESKLVRAIEKIDSEILSDTDFKQVLGSILGTAMELTGSDLSVIVLADGQTMTATSPGAKITARNRTGETERDELEAYRLVRERYDGVLKTRHALALPDRRVSAVVGVMLGRPDTTAQWPAWLVPLEIEDTPFGVLGVFSRRRLHFYTPNDLRMLLRMAPLVAMAQKNAKSYRELVSRETESKERLQMLYEIGEQLKTEQGLDQLFRSVVMLVSKRLRSEEAALFVPDEDKRLTKVAVSGPDDETTKRLLEIELSENKESLTGRVFESKKPLLENHISQNEEYVKDYSERLPSRTTRHYLGVPLLIGDEVLGVIRVLNKKVEDYALWSGDATLADEGFGKEDHGLLTMIATQVASAIRNAKFIERNRYFENLVYNSPDPIIVLDKAGNIQNFNRECEKVWGLREVEVSGKPVWNYYKSAEHAKEIGTALWKAHGHTIRDYAARIRDAKGNIIPILLSATLLLDKDGQVVGSIGVFKDEREMLRLEEERMRAEKLAAIGRLAQTVGHDIKHDIGAVLNYVDGLEGSARSDPGMRQACSAIRDAMNEALSKVQNMLMTAKPKPPENRVVTLNSILIDFEASIRNRTSATQIEFSAKYPECDPLVLADRDQMRQILANLLGNSIDAIKLARHARDRQSAGTIELTVAVEKDVLLLTWRDNGCGMSEEAKAKAFTAFFTTKDTGSGLGLFSTKEIVENHGGHITVESAEGRGACFQITLPRFRPPDSPQAMASRSHPVSKELRP